MTSKAILAAGPFHRIGPIFQPLVGVEDVQYGYTGGVKDAPQADEVATGRTGHVEAVQIAFAADRISYAALLDKFWAVHDPTAMDFNGAEAGAQYRSAIFFHDPAQEKSAIASMAAMQRNFMKPILTLIEPARVFWPAEGSHRVVSDSSLQPNANLI